MRRLMRPIRMFPSFFFLFLPFLSFSLSFSQKFFFFGSEEGKEGREGREGARMAI